MRQKHPDEWKLKKDAEQFRKDASFIKCDVCDMKFLTPGSLSQHRWRNHSVEEKSYAKTKIETNKCDICNRGHPSKDALRWHRNKYHQNMDK